ncbi:hypothetical protein FRX31_028228 [Thalictrum thalictroides]|uniref:Uncharacterized protein n=1 Tax=Thalictrum thalictroides TaxID=46969 RepID=A0A7J6VAR6_THATH|nr:hypothetical protein FRX31_028228 [Thalictrum thalictroides]
MLSYARICIEVEANKELPKYVSIRINENRTLTLDIDYPWKPFICSKCKVFSHSNCEVQLKSQNLKEGEVQNDENLEGQTSEQVMEVNRDVEIVESVEHDNDKVTEAVAIEDGVAYLIETREKGKQLKQNYQQIPYTTTSLKESGIMPILLNLAVMMHPQFRQQRGRRKCHKNPRVNMSIHTLGV